MRPRRAILFAISAIGAAVLALACKKVLGLNGEPIDYDSVFVETGVPGEVQTDADTEVPIDLPGDAACPSKRITDPKNCGSCGHDCLGAACQAGRCVPERVSDVAARTNGAFAVKDGKVFTSERDNLIRTAPNDSTVVLSAGGVGSNPESIFVDDARIVWSSYTNGLLGCPIGGCAAEPTQISQPAKPTHAIAPLPGSTAPWPYVWLGGTSLQTYGPSGAVGITDAGVGEEAQCGALSANAAFVFFADFNNGRILTIKKLGSAAAIANIYRTEFPCGLAARGNLVFWADLKSVWRASIENDGSITSAVALANETSMPGVFTTDDAYVYWAATTGTIFRCRFDGCDGKPETVVASLPAVQHLAVDGAYLYFSTLGNETAGSQIWRVAR